MSSEFLPGAVSLACPPEADDNARLIGAVPGGPDPARVC